MSCQSPQKKRKTRRGNATRFRALKKSFLNHDRYYPIYIGYSHTDVPVFEYATCAITWQLTRYLRDHVKTKDFEYPSWIRYIGTVASSELKLSEEKLAHFANSTSQLEAEFYKCVKFYKLPESAVVSSGHGSVPEEIFLLCVSTLRDQCDYMSSSNSLYRKNMACINHPTDLIFKPHPNLSTSKSDNGLYKIGRSLKEYFKKAYFASYGMS